MTDRGRTHWEGCYRDPRHHECAMARIGELDACRKRLVRGIVASGEALEEGDTDEAYHQLYVALREVGYDDFPNGTFASARATLNQEDAADHG